MRFLKVPIAAALILAFGMTACASDNAGPGTPNDTGSASVNIQVFKLGSRANSAKGTVVVYAYDDPVAATSSARPASGNRFVAIDVEGCAGENADETTGIGPLFFYVQQKGGDPYYPTQPGVREPALHETSLAPGRCARGWVTFEIPTPVKPDYAFFRSLSRRAWLLPK